MRRFLDRLQHWARCYHQRIQQAIAQCRWRVTIHADAAVLPSRRYPLALPIRAHALSIQHSAFVPMRQLPLQACRGSFQAAPEPKTAPRGRFHRALMADARRAIPGP